MGGRIALTAAVRSPGLLDALVIESANPGIECMEERARRASLDDQRAADLRCGGVAPFMEEWYRAPLWESLRANPGPFAAMLQRRAMVDLELAAAHLERLSPGRMPSLWGDLPRLRVPTLFVAGSADEKYRAVLTRAANAVPGSRLSIVQGAGHNSHLERPDGFLHAVRDFLEDPAVDS
jgi:2-succinyl-6-hydroxy-2,4-cyclohexadiene-1-carboxylate synthase